MWSPNDKVWSPKWENEESNFVKIWNYWRILRKNIPLSLKMSASGGLRSPTPPTGFAPGPHGDFSPQAPSFVESKKILKLYSAAKSSWTNFFKSNSTEPIYAVYCTVVMVVGDIGHTKKRFAKSADISRSSERFMQVFLHKKRTWRSYSCLHYLIPPPRIVENHCLRQI